MYFWFEACPPGSVHTVKHGSVPKTSQVCLSNTLLPFIELARTKLPTYPCLFTLTNLTFFTNSKDIENSSISISHANCFIHYQLSCRVTSLFYFFSSDFRQFVMDLIADHFLVLPQPPDNHSAVSLFSPSFSSSSLSIYRFS